MPAVAISCIIAEHFVTFSHQVRQQVKANKVVACLKTDAPDGSLILILELRSFFGNRSKDHTGLLFPSRSGSPRSYSNLYNRDLRPKLEKLGFYVPGAGAHCFRRFRAAQLQRATCLDDLRKFWLGHAS